MSRRIREDGEGFGSDSFLDVICNMVGIMVILVLIAGMRARNAAVPTATAAPAKDQALATLEAENAALEGDVLLLAQDIERVKLAAAARAHERSQLAFVVAARRRAIDERRQTLDAGQQGDFDLRRSAAAAEQALREMLGQLSATEQGKPESIKVTSYPTPISKTVTGKELHLQLKGGRIAYVPINEFEGRLPGEIRRIQHRLVDSPEATDSCGPIDGFRMRYTFERLGNYARLRQCEFIPISPALGETLEQAIGSNSELRGRLAQHRPAATTITLWTYGDSFSIYRRLKEELYQAGFSVAGRPMPDGKSIGGSPSGSKSAAE
ncbi:MAG: hypothetical protein K2Y37_03475 [Pirellulales bacterium]|nr:hypothetical protein [Pirellulales bacterium]